MRAASRRSARRAVSTGVRRSSSPLSISTGTSGSEPGGGPGAGAGEASGQRRHMRMKSLPALVARSKGRKAAAGICANAARISAKRVTGSEKRVQGNGISSQLVAA